MLLTTGDGCDSDKGDQNWPCIASLIVEKFKKGGGELSLDVQVAEEKKQVGEAMADG